MKVNNENDLIMAVVIATILFFLMVSFIVSYFILYRRKREQHAFEMQAAKKEYEKQLLQSQLEIQEQTFSHLSQEIHDNVGQLLTIARIQINIMNERDDFDRVMMNEVKQNIGKAMADLRDIARSMNTDKVRTADLCEAVRSELERISKGGVIQATILTDGVERSIDDQKKLILFRIIQECIQNILKHAEASKVIIRFNYTPDGLEIEVRDNGKGFAAETVQTRSSGLGLANIRTRAALIGGSAIIESDPINGTLILIKMPYE